MDHERTMAGHGVDETHGQPVTTWRRRTLRSSSILKKKMLANGSLDSCSPTSKLKKGGNHFSITDSCTPCFAVLQPLHVRQQPASGPSTVGDNVSLPVLSSSSHHGPIGGPITSKVIGPGGGTLEVHGNRIEIPPGALRENTRMELGLVWNDALRPSMASDCQMTALLSCEPSGVCFLKPVVLILRHCLVMTPSQMKKLKLVLYSSHHKTSGKPNWERRIVKSDDFILGPQNLEVTVDHFCYFVWTFEDGSEIKAKRILITMYSSPICEGQDQNVRLHLMDDSDGVKEKVIKEEKELHGRRLSSYFSFVLLRNYKNLNIQLRWCTPGWVLCCQNIEIPFKEMWSFDHNSSELHFLNETNQRKFQCVLDVHQVGNESKVSMQFCHDVQVTNSDHCRKSARAPPSGNYLSHPLQESTPLRSAASRAKGQPLQLKLPAVPPPPDIPNSLLSVSLPQNAGDVSQGSAVRKKPPPRNVSQSSIDSIRGGDGGQGLGNISGPITLRRGNVSWNGQPANESQLPVVEDTPSQSHVVRWNGTQSQVAITQPMDYRDDIHRHAIVSGNDQAMTQFFSSVQHVTLKLNHNPGTADFNDYDGTPPVIPLRLRKELGGRLDGPNVVNGWLYLASHWGLEYSHADKASSALSPGLFILTIAEERKIITSLDDVIEAMEEIERCDCADLIKDYITKYGTSTSTGNKRQAQEKRRSDSSPEIMDCQESPSPTGKPTTSTFSEAALYHPGVDPPPRVAPQPGVVDTINNILTNVLHSKDWSGSASMSRVTRGVTKQGTETQL